MFKKKRKQEKINKPENRGEILFVSLSSLKVAVVHLQIPRVMEDLFNHISLKVEGVEMITLSSRLPFFTQVLLFISFFF